MKAGSHAKGELPPQIQDISLLGLPPSKAFGFAGISLSC